MCVCVYVCMCVCVYVCTCVRVYVCVCVLVCVCVYLVRVVLGEQVVRGEHEHLLGGRDGVRACMGVCECA